MNRTHPEADEALDPTQMRSVVKAPEGFDQDPVLRRMEEHLSVTSRSIATLTHQSLEQIRLFHDLSTTMRLIALATSLGGLAIVVVLIYVLREILAIFAVSFLIAYMLDPLVSRLEREGANRTLVVAMLSVLLLGLVALGGVYFVEAAITQLDVFVDNLPLIVEVATNKLREWEALLKLWVPSLTSLDLAGQVESAIRDSNVVERIVPTAAASLSSNFLPILMGLGIVPFLTFFMLNNGRQMRKGLIAATPNRYFESILVLMAELDRQLGEYIRSRVIETVVLSVLASIALQLMGIHFAIILGGLFGLANLIPYFGPILGTIPPALVALTGSYLGDFGVLGVIGLSFLLQFVDNAILFPLVVGKSVDLGPAATIFVVLVGSEFFGLVGLLLAVPIAAMLKVVVQVVYHEARGYWKY